MTLLHDMSLYATLQHNTITPLYTTFTSQNITLPLHNIFIIKIITALGFPRAASSLVCSCYVTLAISYYLSVTVVVGYYCSMFTAINIGFVPYIPA